MISSERVLDAESDPGSASRFRPRSISGHAATYIPGTRESPYVSCPICPLGKRNSAHDVQRPATAFWTSQSLERGPQGKESGRRFSRVEETVSGQDRAQAESVNGLAAKGADKSDFVGASDTPSRRAFLGGVGKKAAYIVPVISMLPARSAFAAGSAGSAVVSCVAQNDPCIADTDCCSGMCQSFMCTGM